ncbi:Rhodanese-like protein [Jackrogersella minutella]|nr:Rhodanese-like protein [Jackrogersella minutella]
MATRRLATSAAVLRGESFRAAGSMAPRLLQAPFSTSSPARRLLETTATTPATARLRTPRRVAPAGVRWLSDSVPGSKTWNFEELQAAVSSPPTSKPRVTIIDTREPMELTQTGRIPGALNIPISSAPDSFHIGADEFRDRYGFDRPPAGGDVVFYCKAGVRSRAAARIARDAGYTNVGEYPGSWLDWVKNGGAVER